MSFFKSFNANLVNAIHKTAVTIGEYLNSTKQSTTTNNDNTSSDVSLGYTRKNRASLDTVFNMINSDFDKASTELLISESDLSDLNILRGDLGDFTANICYYSNLSKITKKDLYDYIILKGRSPSGSPSALRPVLFSGQLKELSRMKQSFTNKSYMDVFDIPYDVFYDNFLKQALIYFEPAVVLMDIAATLPAVQKQSSTSSKKNTKSSKSKTKNKQTQQPDLFDAYDEYYNTPAVDNDPTGEQKESSINNALDQNSLLNLANVITLTSTDYSNFPKKLKEGINKRLAYMQKRNGKPAFSHYDLTSFVKLLKGEDTKVVTDEHGNKTTQEYKSDHSLFDRSNYAQLSKKLQSVRNKLSDKYGDKEGLSTFIHSLEQASDNNTTQQLYNIGQTEAELAIIQVSILEYFYNEFAAWFASLSLHEDWYNINKSAMDILTHKDLSTSTGEEATDDNDDGKNLTEEEKLDQLYNQQYGNIHSSHIDDPLTSNAPGKRNKYDPDTIKQNVLSALDAAREDTSTEGVNNMQQILANMADNLTYQVLYPTSVSLSEAQRHKAAFDTAKRVIGDQFTSYFPSDADVIKFTEDALKKYSIQIQDYKRNINRVQNILSALERKKKVLQSAEKEGSLAKTNKSVLISVDNKIKKYREALEKIDGNISSLIKMYSSPELQEKLKIYKDALYAYNLATRSPKTSKAALLEKEYRKNDALSDLEKTRTQLKNVLKDSDLLNQFLDSNYDILKDNTDIQNTLQQLYEERVKYEDLLREALHTVSDFDKNTASVEEVDILIQEYKDYLQNLQDSLQLAKNTYQYNVFDDVTNILKKRENNLYNALRKTSFDDDKKDEIISEVLYDFSKKYKVIQYTVDDTVAGLKSRTAQDAGSAKANTQKNLLTRSYNSLISYNLATCLEEYNNLLDQKAVDTNGTLIDKTYLFNHFKDKIFENVKKYVSAYEDLPDADARIEGSLAILVQEDFQGVVRESDMVIALCYLSKIINAFYGNDKATGQPKNPSLIAAFEEDYHKKPLLTDYNKTNPLYPTNKVLQYLFIVDKYLRRVPYDDFSDKKDERDILIRYVAENYNVLTPEDKDRIIKRCNELINGYDEVVYGEDGKTPLKDKNGNVIKKHKDGLRKLVPEYETLQKDENNILNVLSNYKNLTEDELASLQKQLDSLYEKREQLLQKSKNMENESGSTSALDKQHEKEQIARENLPFKTSLQDSVSALTDYFQIRNKNKKDKENNNYDAGLDRLINRDNIDPILEMLVSTDNSNQSVHNRLEKMFPSSVIENWVSEYRIFVDEGTKPSDFKNLIWDRESQSFFTHLADFIVQNRQNVQKVYSNRGRDAAKDYLSNTIVSAINNPDSIEQSAPGLYGDLVKYNKQTEDEQIAKDTYNTEKKNTEQAIKDYHSNKDNWSIQYKQLSQEVFDLNTQINELEDTLTISKSYTPEQILGLKQKADKLSKKVEQKRTELEDMRKEFDAVNSPREILSKIDSLNKYLEGAEAVNDKILNSIKKQEYIRKTRKNTFLDKNVKVVNNQTYLFNSEEGKWQRVLLDDNGIVKRRFDRFLSNVPDESTPAKEKTPNSTAVEQSVDQGTATNKSDVQSAYRKPGAWMHITAQGNNFLGEREGFGGQVNENNFDNPTDVGLHKSTTNLENMRNQEEIENPGVRIEDPIKDLSFNQEPKKSFSMKEFGNFLKALRVSKPAEYNKVIELANQYTGDSAINLPEFLQMLSAQELAGETNPKFMDAVDVYNRKNGTEIKHRAFQQPMEDKVFPAVEKDPELSEEWQKYKSQESLN